MGDTKKSATGRVGGSGGDFRGQRDGPYEKVSHRSHGELYAAALTDGVVERRVVGVGGPGDSLHRESLEHGQALEGGGGHVRPQVVALKQARRVALQLPDHRESSELHHNWAWQKNSAAKFNARRSVGGGSLGLQTINAGQSPESR
eukprot:156980-Prorocentrum_minimum.AAC.1